MYLLQVLRAQPLHSRLGALNNAQGRKADASKTDATGGGPGGSNRGPRPPKSTEEGDTGLPNGQEARLGNTGSQLICCSLTSCDTLCYAICDRYYTC